MQYDLKKVTHLIYGFAIWIMKERLVSTRKRHCDVKNLCRIKEKASQTKNNDRFRRLDRMFYLFCNILG
jgi:hypothetical protein